jgi:hypothetical protein
MKLYKIFTRFLILAAFSTAVAQPAKYSNEFLGIGVGARALGMGYTNVASVNDMTSGYWNPAGLMGIQSNLQAGMMHTEYFAGIAKYDFGSIAAKLDSFSTGSISFIRFGIDNIPNTTDLIDANGNVDYDRISTFNATDFALMLTYAQYIERIPGLDFGTNVKIIRRRIGDFAGAWGFGLDAGATYKYKDFKFAAVGKDITGTFNAWSYNLPPEMISTFQITGNEIPVNNVEVTVPRLILGAAYTKNVFKDKIGITGEINLTNTFDGKRNVLIKTNSVSVDPSLGLEVGYVKTIFLRTGLNNIQKITDVTGKSVTSIQPNFGVGLKYKIFSLDYAMTNFSNSTVSTYSHVFSLKLDINKFHMDLHLHHRHHLHNQHH